MARSTYYYHIAHLPDPDKYDEIKQRIYAIYEHHKGRYGYRRITLQLRNDGVFINHKTVQRLMADMGLKAKVKHVKYRSYKGDVGRIAPNVIDRDFKTTGVNQKWATDITEYKIHEEKGYLSPVLDMNNGEIVAYTKSRHPDLQLVIDMVDAAIEKENPPEGLVLHSDQGWHYQHKSYQTRLKNNGLIQSMSRKGNCLDNSMMENFFGLMKSELLYLQNWNTLDEFEAALDEYIEYYNNDRIKLRLGGMSPAQYRARQKSNL